MNIVRFIKKQAAGFYLSVLAIIIAAVAMVMFFTVDPTFKSFLKSMYVAPYVACTVIAMVLEIAVIVSEQIFAAKRIDGILRSVIITVLHAAAVVLFCTGIVQMIWSGIYEAVMAFGSALGDNMTANYYLAVVIVGAVGMILSMVSAFLPTLKKD